MTVPGEVHYLEDELVSGGTPENVSEVMGPEEQRLLIHIVFCL